MHTHARTHAPTDTHARTHAHNHTRTRTHTTTHTDTRTHTSTHAHTHIHKQAIQDDLRALAKADGAETIPFFQTAVRRHTRIRAYAHARART